MDILLKQESGDETGTLYHLANVCRNSNIKLNPLEDYQRVKDSFLSMVNGYVTAATLSYIGATSIEDAKGFVPTEIEGAPVPTQCRWLLDIIRPLVVKFCQFGVTDVHDGVDSVIHQPRQNFLCRSEGCARHYLYEKCRNSHEIKKHNLRIAMPEDQQLHDNGNDTDTDGVLNYGCNVITLGLMIVNCDDAIREGDGARITKMYKWWLLIWRSQESTKYSLASIQLQVQIKCLLDQQTAHRLIWNRTVNRSGGKGKRVALDFHMENLVQAMKQSLKHLGVNVTERAAAVESKALKAMIDLVESHNVDLNVTKPSGHHKKTISADVGRIVQVLLDKRMFCFEEGRMYASFPKMQRPLLSDLDVSKLKVWLEDHVKKWKYEDSKIKSRPF